MDQWHVEIINAFTVKVKFSTFSLFSSNYKEVIIKSDFIQNRYNGLLKLVEGINDQAVLFEKGSPFFRSFASWRQFSLKDTLNLLSGADKHTYKFDRTSVNASNTGFQRWFEDSNLSFSRPHKTELINDAIFYPNRVVQFFHSDNGYDKYAPPSLDTFFKIENGTIDYSDVRNVKRSPLKNEYVKVTLVPIFDNAQYRYIWDDRTVRKSICSVFINNFENIYALTHHFVQWFDYYNRAGREHKFDLNRVPGVVASLIMKGGMESHFIEKPKHRYVSSSTYNSRNTDFGFLGERSLFNFLTDRFTRDNFQSELRDRQIHSTRVTSVKITWLNQNGESYKPYDLVLSMDEPRFRYYIEVKSTRKSFDSDVLFSVSELEKMLDSPKDYLICRVLLIEDSKKYRGIRIHDEFVARFYRFSNNGVSEVRSSLREWKEHYRAKTINIPIALLEEGG